MYTLLKSSSSDDKASSALFLSVRRKNLGCCSGEFILFSHNINQCRAHGEPASLNDFVEKRGPITVSGITFIIECCTETKIL